MHDLNELADAAQGGRQYAAQRRTEKFYRRVAPRSRETGPGSYGPLAWGFGIGIGLALASFLVWLLAFGGLVVVGAILD